MKKILLIVVLTAPCLAATGLEVQHLTRPFAVGDCQVIRIETPVGKLTAETHDGESVEAELMLDCSGKLEPCRELARQIVLSSEVSGDKLVIRVSGPEKFGQANQSWLSYTTVNRSRTPKGRKLRTRSKALKTYGWELTVDLRILYPRSHQLEIRMERGDAVVKGLENDGRLWVEGKGSALVSMRKRDAGSITLRTRGDGVMIRPRGERPLRDKKRLEWREGAGSVELSVEIGGGPIVVELF